MALTIPADYGASVRAGRPAAVQVVADGTDANSTNVALGYAAALVAGYARELASRGSGGAQRRLRSWHRPVVRVWFNPQLESRFFMIPGIAGAPAAGGDDQPVVDGHRAREGERARSSS